MSASLRQSDASALIVDAQNGSTPSLPRLLHAVLQLALVFRVIELPSRLRNQPILPNLPLFEPAEPHWVSRSAPPGIRPDKCPVVNRAVTLDADIIHPQHHVWKRAHESLRHLCDGASPHVGSAIHAQRSVLCEESRHTRGVSAAPRRRIPLGKISQESWFTNHPCFSQSRGRIPPSPRFLY